MKRLLRWTGIALGSLVVLAVAAYLIVHVLAERELRRTYPLPAVALAIPTDAASIAEGQRLATVRGCYNGCHGKQAEGMLFFNQPAIARIVAPNLTAAVRQYSDAQLAVIIRNGLRPDGRSLLVMPSETFAGLTDEDTGRIIAFLRSLPLTPGPAASISAGPIGRIGLAVGQFKMAARLIAEADPPPAGAGPEAARGRYLALTVCSECHGSDLRGMTNPDFTSPDLRTVAAYQPEDFTRLLRTGIALGERSLPTMGPSAQKNLSHLTDGEIADLYAYLHAVPEDSRP